MVTLTLSSAGRFATGLLFFPVYGWDFSKWLLVATFGRR